MYIKSVVIDGFKSYANRVEINDFDKGFNAITGANGSGKSNVLDSICFVLGIDKKHVRANDNKELIFKNGQAGITKCSVSITFDNSDKNRSPIGYETDQEIVVCRQVSVTSSRFLINGSTVRPKVVEDLFCSVNLNWRNPHFLIQQGRVTKVLSMKPLEILAMLEEAAGTGMYETKKAAATKLIANKDSKLSSLNSTLNKTITPKLDRLKEEKIKFLELQKVSRQCEHLGKIYIAFSYTTMEKDILDKTKEKEGTIVECEQIEELVAEKEKEMSALSEKISQVEGTVGENAKIQEIQNKIRTEKSNEATVLAIYSSADDGFKAEVQKLKLLKKNVADDEKALALKEKEWSKMEEKYQKLRSDDERNKEAYTAAQQALHAISAGLHGGENGYQGSLLDEVMSLKTKISTDETNIKRIEITLKRIKGDIDVKRKFMKATQGDCSLDQQELEKKQKEFARLEAELKNMNYTEGEYEKLQSQLEENEHALRTAKGNLSFLLMSNPNVEFRYKKDTSIDDSKIYGRLCRLFKVRDEKFALALETALMNGLYNVVIDSKHIGKLLLRPGYLDHRTTFLPLDAIQRHTMRPEVIREAQNLVGKDNVFPALQLISYEPKYQAAMEFAFGNFFIAADKNVAKTVTFNNRIKTKCITLDGDIYHPSGSLSGGSKVALSGTLAKVQEIIALEKELNTYVTQRTELEKRSNKMAPLYQKYTEKKTAMDLLKHHLKRSEERLQQTTYNIHKTDYDKLVAEEKTLQEELIGFQQSLQESREKCREMESYANDMEGHRNRQLQKAKKDMDEYKRKAEQSEELWKKKEQEYETRKLEIEDLKKSIESGTLQVKEKEKELEKLKAEVEQHLTEVNATKERINILSAELENLREIITEKNREIQQLKDQWNKCKSEIKQSTTRKVQLEDDRIRLEHDIEKLNDKINDLNENNPWIATEKGEFGQEGGIYNFTSLDLQDVSKKYQKMKETKDKLERTVNKKVMRTLKEEENQYNDTMNKKKIVEKDRALLMNTIETLDAEKKQILETAFQKVNTGFNSIFSTVLAGAKAQLTTLPGKDILDGLEIKVGFGEVWKDNLSELSGGQRSLVALSLILSMLLYKPAPLYILDEVDAALDLCHTQNIGLMLKKHFEHSQFIVVSLKEGLFRHANVLFRTQYNDGTSSVMRTVNKKEKSKH